MIELLPPYAIFSVLALAAKTFMVVRYRLQIFAYSIWFKVLLVVLFGVNILELSSFYYPRADETAFLLLTLYYLFIISASAMILCVSLDVLGKRSGFLFSLVLVPLVVTMVLVLIPDFIISGVKHIGYTFTRIPGRYYWVFQILYLSYVFGTLAALLHAHFFTDDSYRARKAKALLFALTPLIALSPLVIVLMQMGVEITGTVFGSFAILFFLMTSLATNNEIIKDSFSDQKGENVFKLLSSVPATAEFKLANRVRRAVAKNDSYGLEKAVVNYERTLVLEAIHICNNNKSAAAKLLGISRTTLRRRLLEYTKPQA